MSTSPAPAAPRRLPRTGPAAIAVGALLIALAGCTSTPAESAPTPSAAATATRFAPVTADNCGTPVTVTAPPKRVLTIKSTATEMLLALGLQDSMVGTAFADGPVPAAVAAAYGSVPVLSDNVPGPEAVLAAAPDFIYGGWESNFSADGAGDRAALAALGIASYVSPAACQEACYQPDPLTLDAVFVEIREVASVFGVGDRAEALITQQKALLAKVTPPATATTALWYSSGSDAPYVGAGIGAPQMMMDAVGLTNIFADVHDTWTSAGWEQVVAADPDVIVLVDATWNTAAKKIEMLEANPATSKLTAVREHRFLTIPFPAAEAGVRNADAVVDLSAQLAALSPAS